MSLRLFLLFTLVPALELYLLVRIGQALGAGATLLLVVVTGMLGATFARREGLSVLLRLQEEARQGVPPTGVILEGALILVGGLLLVTPGVLTDLVGLLLVFGPTRRRVAPALGRALGRRFQVHTFGPPAGGPRPPGGARPPEGDPPDPFDHPRA